MYLRKWASSFPRDVGVDPQGNVYVTEQVANRVAKYDGNGVLIGQWTRPGDAGFGSLEGLSVDSSGNVYVASVAGHFISKFDGSGALLTRWGSFGSGPGEFYSPHYLAIGVGGAVYVADHANHRVQKFAFPTVASGAVTWTRAKGVYRAVASKAPRR
jgi:DNA-binding beta-propeller fold protein YncE